MKRLLWLDIAKGLAILWVVYFHFFQTYRGAPSPMSGNFVAEVAGEHGFVDTATAVRTSAKLVWYAVTEVGYHAVGVFIILSGWSLAAATVRRAAKGPIAWGDWYKSRFIRLYPMYWLAHLVYLLSPFVARLEPLDARVFISLSGLRMINIESNFFYINAAWWYFAMLIQLYLIFPVLFVAMRKMGLIAFLVVAFFIGFGMRYLMLEVWHSLGPWILGGNCLSRLPEFALGMVLGMLHVQSSERVERGLLGGAGLALGIALYFVAPFFYSSNTAYVFADLWTGTCCFLCILGVAGCSRNGHSPRKWVGLAGAFSYGIYLVHQPYVIWLGLRIQDQPAWIFFLIVIVTLVALGTWGVWLEKFANAALERLLGAGKKPSVAR